MQRINQAELANGLSESESIDALFDPSSNNYRKRKKAESAQTDTTHQIAPADGSVPPPKKIKLTLKSADLSTSSSQSMNREASIDQARALSMISVTEPISDDAIDSLFLPVTTTSYLPGSTHIDRISDDEIDALFLPSQLSNASSSTNDPLNQLSENFRENYVAMLSQLGISIDIAEQISTLYVTSISIIEMQSYCHLLLTYFSVSELVFLLSSLKLDKNELRLLTEKLPMITQHGFKVGDMTIGKTIHTKRVTLRSFLQYAEDILNVGLKRNELILLLLTDYQLASQMLAFTHQLIVAAQTHECGVQNLVTALQTAKGRELICNSLKNRNKSLNNTQMATPAKRVMSTDVTIKLLEDLKFSTEAIQKLVKNKRLPIVVGLCDHLGLLLDYGFTHEQVVEVLLRPNGSLEIIRLSNFADKLISLQFTHIQLLKLINRSTVDILETITTLYAQLSQLGFSNDDIYSISAHREGASTLKTLAQYHSQLTQKKISKDQIIRTAKCNHEPSHLIKLLAGVSPAELNLLASLRDKSWYRLGTEECILICERNTAAEPTLYFTTKINRFAEILSDSKKIRCRTKLMQSVLYMPNNLWELLWPNKPLPAQFVSDSDLLLLFNQPARFLQSTEPERKSIWIKCDNSLQATVNFNMLQHLLNRINKDAKESGEAAEIFAIERFREYIIISDYDIFLHCLQYEEPYKTSALDLPKTSDDFPMIPDQILTCYQAVNAKKKSKHISEKIQREIILEPSSVVDEDTEAEAQVNALQEADDISNATDITTTTPLENPFIASPATPFAASDDNPFSPGLTHAYGTGQYGIFWQPVTPFAAPDLDEKQAHAGNTPQIFSSRKYD